MTRWDNDAHRERCRTYRQKNLEQQRAKDRAREGLKTFEQRRTRHLKNRYGLTPEALETMRRGQNFSCKICSRPEWDLNRPLVVDHNHETGEVRGLLCFSCNTGLGQFNDSPELLRRALAYVDPITGKPY